MSAKLHGPFGELYEFASGADALGTSDALFAPQDAELLDRLLLGFMEDPLFYEPLRAMLSLPDAGEVDVAALRIELARQLASGGLVLRSAADAPATSQSGGVLPGVTITSPGHIVEREAPRVEPRRAVRDWRFECSHHTSAAARDLIEHQSRIQVVPDKGELSDVVKIHIKDELHRPPPALHAGSTQIPKSGSSEGYDVYDFEARYRGDVDQTAFILPRFWSAYMERTTYQVQGAPSSISVEVFNPRQYKFEFKFPAMKGMKYGSKLQKDVQVEGRRLVAKGEYKETWKREESGWSPSTLVLNKRETSDKEPNAASGKPKKALFDSIAFYVDSTKREVAILDLIGAILNTAKSIQDIVEAIQENAPKVGWYMQFELQLMQGQLAVEWYWKEHTNHQVFQYIDVNLQLTIASLTFELGIGISGLGFKAQVFAQVSGELTVSLDGRRDDPSWAPGVALPAKATFKGAIGARFEAGNFFKAEGKGETGIEFAVEVGVNRGQGRMLALDAGIDWTGIKVSAVVKGGLFGLGAERTWERVIAGPAHLREFHWPKPEPYAPARMSRDAIRNVVLGVITEGLDVRVIREREGWFSDEHWTAEQIADAIADRMDQHRTFSRRAKVVEGIAHAIRQDLDNLGSRTLARDYIEERAFLAYVNGPTLRGYLDAAIPPEAALAQAAGH